MQEAYGDRLQITWRNFALEQVNQKHGEGWRIWDQPDDFETRGLWALRASEAVRNQGLDIFERFRMTLLVARHENGVQLADRAALTEVARQSGADLERFERDLADRSLLSRIAADYEAAEQLGVFGTPTFVFPNGQAMFLKMRPTPDTPEQSVAFFEEFRRTAEGRSFIHELKRPTPPRS